MKHYERDGIDFITDLVWQQPVPNEKFSLKTYRDDCSFDFYCKTTKLGSTYGFGRYPKDGDGNLLLKLKNPLSLALYIIESVDIEAEKGVNIFVCFCFDDNHQSPSYGYIFLYNGSILPEDGEFIGSIEEVKARIKNLAKTYNAKAAFVPDDVPFHNDISFEYETGLEIYELKSHLDEKSGQVISASEYIFWRKIKSKKSASRLRNLDDKRQKQLIILIMILIMLSAIGFGVKSYFFPNVDMDDVEDNVVQTTVPISYPANIFIDACLSKFNKFAVNKVGWQLNSYKCTVKGLEISYLSNGGKLLDLQTMIGESVNFNSTGANLKIKIDLPNKSLNTMSAYGTLAEQVDNLEDAGQKLGFVVNVSQKRVDISSSYSPIFLYENGIINKLNLSEITVTLNNSSGFMDWKIIGEINAK